jgi:hypothetical protein
LGVLENLLLVQGAPARGSSSGEESRATSQEVARKEELN